MTIIKHKVKTIDIRNDRNCEMKFIRKILILAANPKLTSRLRLEEEARGINDGLKRSKFRNCFEINWEWAVRHRDIRQALLEYKPNFVHFTGHGKDDGILIEDEMGIATQFPAKAFAELLKLCSDHVECVILNACHTGRLAILINKYIDYVVGMKKEINDKAAIEFSIGFYDALGAGCTIEEAFEFGRTAIMVQPSNLPEYLIPILKRRKNIVNLRLYLEATKDIYIIRVPIDIGTLVLKNRLLEELKFPKVFEDGKFILYFLLNKTKEQIMNDGKTLRENEIQENETISFLFEYENEV